MFRLSRARQVPEVKEEMPPPMPNRSRQLYLQRLGIQGADKAMEELRPPSSALEACAGGAVAAEQRSGADFRQKYLQKLAYNNVWVPQAHRAPKHQTVIIFDWDDTLLCTSWLRDYDYERGVGPVEEVPLRQIARYAREALEVAVRAGPTYIITNAAVGWVEYSAAKWAPELLPILRQVRVISARDKFEASFPDDVMQWKIHAFLEVQRQLDSTPITNLVVLGDADYEIEAARIMGGEFEEGLVKTVKFQRYPEPEAHVKELELVSKNMEKIIGSVRNLKVVLQQKQG